MTPFFQILATTFATVFLAELGDKTQLATLSFASGNESKLAVFLGSACALVATSAIAVLLGSTLGRFINPVYLKIGGGALFIILGVMMLWHARE